MAVIYELVQSLNILAYGAYPPADGLGVRDADKAANDWASTTGLDLIGALNAKNGVTQPGRTWLDLNAVCNALNSTPGSGREAQDALSDLAGGGHT